MYLSVPTLLPPNSKFEYSRKNTELRIKKFNSSSHLCPYIILLFTGSQFSHLYGKAMRPEKQSPT